jgi:glycosyltransferase involved in cell wall biosynthesis
MAVVAAVPMSINAFMVPHIEALSATREVTIVSSGVVADLRVQMSERVLFAPIPIARAVTLAGDLRSMWQLWRLFRTRRFGAVQSITPKAGLLSMVAARMAGVPVRVHWFTGQVWATKSGLVRWALKSLDRLLVACATDLLADSPSQRDFLEREGIVAPGRIVVLGAGSVCGVDTARFRPDDQARRRVRAAHGIPEKATVCLFLGRLTRDKGVVELARAFAACAHKHPDVWCLVVGPDEGGMREVMTQYLGTYVARVEFAGHSASPEQYLAAADVFVLPSYREGFGSSVLEAASCGIPAIGTKIYGLSDAIADGLTGVLVPVRDISALENAIDRMVADTTWRTQLGAQARVRAQTVFAQEVLTDALEAFYEARMRRPVGAA